MRMLEQYQVEDTSGAKLEATPEGVRRLMVEAGQKFLLITSKHHDGFCLWDTALADFKVTNTPLGRDVLAELTEALHARRIGLHFFWRGCEQLSTGAVSTTYSE